MAWPGLRRRPSGVSSASDPSGADVLEDEAAVVVDVQHHAPQQAIHTVAVALPRVAADLLDQVEQDHRHREHLERLRSGVGDAPDVAPVVGPDEEAVEDGLGLAHQTRLTARPSDFRKRHRVEALAEDLALEGLRTSVGGELEVDAPVVAEGVFAQEIGARARHRQPRGPLLDRPVELGEHPRLPPLQPDVLGRAVDAAVAVEAVEVAAVRGVGAVALPEREHALEEFGLVAAAKGGDLHRWGGGDGVLVSCPSVPSGTGWATGGTRDRRATGVRRQQR